jgi:hypothetical protein
MTPMLASLLIKAREPGSRMPSSALAPRRHPRGRGPGRRRYGRVRWWLGIGGAVTEDVVPVLSTALSRHVAPVPQPAASRAARRAEPQAWSGAAARVAAADPSAARVAAADPSAARVAAADPRGAGIAAGRLAAGDGDARIAGHRPADPPATEPWFPLLPPGRRAVWGCRA